MIFHGNCVADVMVGDCVASMRTLLDKSVQMCVTSPPYFGLRDYGHDGQLGLETTPDLYIAAMVEVFREVRRILADDGVLWLNIGDSYAANRGYQVPSTKGGLKPKDLIGIPWMLAFALRADGWYLRQDIIWHKPNPMPESVTDRCTKSHEYVFMLSKSAKYYYNNDAIKTPMKESSISRLSQANLENQNGSDRIPGKTNGNMKAVGKIDKQRGHSRRHAGFNDRWDAMSKDEQCAGGANKRSVWTVATKPYKGAHFATFPPALIEPCILAGSKPGDIVIDPFGGCGTTAGVALLHGRHAILCELNAEYAALVPSRVDALVSTGHTDAITKDTTP